MVGLVQSQQSSDLRIQVCGVSRPGLDGEWVLVTLAQSYADEAYALRAALEQAEQALRRVQIHVGLLRQYDPELSMVVARARETANTALAKTKETR
jgi:hypothetical protein